MSHAHKFDFPFALEPEQKDFLAFVVEHFSAAYYSAAYTDVAESYLEPLQHWLTFGFADQRQISRSVVLRHREVARRSSSRIWQHYRWRGVDIAARVIKPLRPEVVAQIANQARHDPAVLAASMDSVQQLSQQDRENVHLDVAGLRRALPYRPEFLLIVSDIGTSPAQAFAADLAFALSETGFRSIQTIVVDSNSCADAVPASCQMTNVVFWRDFWIHGPESVNSGQLAQLISVVRPRVTILADSRRGYALVARYGRALSERTKLYCLCPAESEGNDTNSLLVLQTLPFATVLTDDVAFAERLRQRSAHSGHGVVPLANHSAAAFCDAIAALFGRP